MLEINDVARFEYMWRNNGFDANQTTKMSIQDAISTTNAPSFLPKVISNIALEAAEPILVGASLLQRINYSAGQQINFPAMGALQAADIPEGGEYPEKDPSMGGSTVTAFIGKSGVAVKITEEMIRYSQFDMINMLIRQAGFALGRLKEEKIFHMFRTSGTVLYDNVNPTSSLFGVTTGRSLSGSGNGSISVDNLFDAYAFLISQGHTPDTLLMHPLAWSMFVKDATLRYFVLQNGGGGSFLSGWQGNPAARAPWGNGMSVAGGQAITPPSAANGAVATETAGYNSGQLQSAPILPNYYGLPLRVVVSPFVTFNAHRKLSDIYLLDSQNAGALVVDEEITTEEFNDPARDMRKIKLRERYALAVLNEGLALGVMKNVHIVPNEVVLPAQSTISVSGQIASISATADVLD